MAAPPPLLASVWEASGDHWPYKNAVVGAHSDGNNKTKSIAKEHDHGK